MRSSAEVSGVAVAAPISATRRCQRCAVSPSSAAGVGWERAEPAEPGRSMSDMSMSVAASLGPRLRGCQRGGPDFPRFRGVQMSRQVHSTLAARSAAISSPASPASRSTSSVCSPSSGGGRRYCTGVAENFIGLATRRT